MMIKRQETQNPISTNFVSFFINIALMVSVTVGLVVLFTNVSTISDFFKGHVNLVYIMMSVTTILLLLLAFVRGIRSNDYAVRILLWIVVILWSVIFASAFLPIGWKYVLIALAVTIIFTVWVVLVAMKLPPLSKKGFIIFLAISDVLGVSAIVVRICYSLITQPEVKSIIYILLGVPVALFILSVMFICVNTRRWMMRWFPVNSMDFILAFVIWCHMISLFAQIYPRLTL
uniref:Uncharacterized protein n=1 Tax=Trichobilharzia regenti TaxID=157069 RepID=A0AA85J1G9_TRIRE|nr:unnamed protein product [Trichobilharzia regenti]CAH8865162.1 unnamed protein product [Trichobilharzia regenti]